MKSFLVLFLGIFLQNAPSQVLVKISDYKGNETKAKIEIYQDKKLIVSKSNQINYQTELPKGIYQLKVIACDTLTVPMKVWNKEHEYQVSVKTDCQ